MIQRIQSVYLLVAALVAAILPFVLTKYQTGDVVLKISQNWPQLSGFLIVALLAIATIFQYKNRKTQVVFGRLNILINFALFAWLYLDFFKAKGDESAVFAGAGIYIPLLVVVFLTLANRAVMRDEKLIRDADRIR
jgi:uncharacterized membrane protein